MAEHERHEERGEIEGAALLAPDVHSVLDASESAGGAPELSEDSSEPQLLIDPVDGRIVAANEAAERFYGWSRPTLCSLRIEQIDAFPSPDIRARLAEARHRHASRFVFLHRLADGGIHPVEFSVEPERIGGRTLLRATIRDLGELSERFPEYEVLLRRYQALVEQLPAVVYAEEVTPPHRKIYVSPAAERLLGWSPATLRVDRATWYERYVLPEDRAWALQEEARTDRTGEPFRVEYRFRTGDGRTIWLRDEAILTYDREGRPWIWHGLLTDITQQKRVEARLQRELAFHNILLGIASTLVTVTSENLEATLTAVFGDLGQFLRVDHLALFCCQHEGISLLGAWHADRQSPAPECPDTAALTALDWLRDRLEQRQVVALARVDDLGAEAAAEERALFESLGIRALVVIPLFAAGTALGCLVAAQRTPRWWSEDDIDLLTLAGQLVTSAILQRRAERAEAQHHAWLRATVLASPDALLVLDHDGIVRFASPATRGVLGLEEAAIIGRPIWDLASDADRVRQWLARELAAERPARLETELATEPSRIVELSGLDLRADEHIGGIVLSIRDVTERHRAQQLLRERATRDSLTGLYNRFGFLEALEATSTAVPAGALGILCCDLERFSTLNDAIGWEAGDAALRAVAARLRHVPEALLVARLEADRFAVLLRSDDRARVPRIAAELLETMSDWYDVGGEEVYLSLRGGLAFIAPDDNPVTALRRAEIAFQMSKRSQRERLAVFDPDLYQQSVDRQMLERDLRRALEQGDLRLHFQPVIALATGQIASLEALVRWQHPVRGPISPAIFVPLAEATGLVTHLTQWVLLQACRQLRRWLRIGLAAELTVSVNLSPTDFLHIDVAQLVQDVLHVTGLEPRHLTLELTESAMLDPAVSREQLERLRRLGIAVVIDDFGAGYSSLGYLKRLPVSGLKLDRELTESVEQDVASQAVVRSVLELARALDLRVTAEGIENEQQLTVLRTLGCDFGQGFAIARPLPPEEIPPLFRER